MISIAGRCKSIAAFLLFALVIGLPVRSYAGAVPFNSFMQFATEGATLATGCQLADPLGAFCTPSSGTPTDVLDAPPWTFTAPQPGAILLVTDVFLAGDRFEVFDFGSSLGSTSAPVGSGDCGDDPVVCLSDPNVSKRSFVLAAGNHSITIYGLTAGSATGYLNVAAVPEPSTLVLLALGGLAAVFSFRRRGSPAC
jgi:hypothetical protein